MPAIRITPKTALKRHLKMLNCALLGILGTLGQVSAKQVSIHDPVMAKENGQYYLFSTGGYLRPNLAGRVRWHLGLTAIYGHRILSSTMGCSICITRYLPLVKTPPPLA